MMFSLFAVSVISVCAFALTSFDDGENVTIQKEKPVASEGKRCNGSVGCDCPGFSPITNGKEYQKVLRLGVMVCLYAPNFCLFDTAYKCNNKSCQTNICQ